MAAEAASWSTQALLRSFLVVNAVTLFLFLCLNELSKFLTGNNDGILHLIGVKNTQNRATFPTEDNIPHTEASSKQHKDDDNLDLRHAQETALALETRVASIRSLAKEEVRSAHDKLLESLAETASLQEELRSLKLEEAQRRHESDFYETSILEA